MFNLLSSPSQSLPEPSIEKTETKEWTPTTPRISREDETPDEKADAKETVTRRKLAYALYREDAYTYGAPVLKPHELAKADLRTYMLKADRIIGFAR